MTMAKNFIDNYQRILTAGPCMLSKGQGSPVPNDAHKMVEIGEFRFFSQDNPTGFYGLKISPNKQMGGHGTGMLENIEVVGATSDEGVRYLDYIANGLTCFEIDASAKVILTGPLTGCFVAVGRSMTGSPTLFHVNENKTKGDAKQNKLNKISMLQQAAASRFSCRLTQILLNADYRTDGAYMAFAFGIKKTDDWSFYYHSAQFDGGSWSIKVGCEELPLY